MKWGDNELTRGRERERDSKLLARFLRQKKKKKSFCNFLSFFLSLSLSFSGSLSCFLFLKLVLCLFLGQCKIFFLLFSADASAIARGCILSQVSLGYWALIKCNLNAN